MELEKKTPSELVEEYSKPLKRFIECIRLEPDKELKFYYEKMGISKKVLWSACKELKSKTPKELVEEYSKSKTK